MHGVPPPAAPPVPVPKPRGPAPTGYAWDAVRGVWVDAAGRVREVKGSAAAEKGLNPRPRGPAPSGYSWCAVRGVWRDGEGVERGASKPSSSSSSSSSSTAAAAAAKGQKRGAAAAAAATLSARRTQEEGSEEDSEEASEEDSEEERDQTEVDGALTELGEDVYEVETLIDVRQSGARKEYRVRWRGYGTEHDTWEKAGDILDKSLVAELEAQQAGGSAGGGSFLSLNRKRHGVGVGPLYQAEVPTTTSSDAADEAWPLPPPAAPPLCHCGRACLWLRSRWWCDTEETEGGCGFEVPLAPAPPPRCSCQLPMRFLLSKWWCQRGASGCGAEQAADASRGARPEPTSLPHASLELEAARATAALLTSAAYGPASEWAFVAPAGPPSGDGQVGLFARQDLKAGQVIGEFGGPRLPVEPHLVDRRGTLRVRGPGRAPVFIDGEWRNSLFRGRCSYPVVHARHEAAAGQPNAKLEMRAVSDPGPVDLEERVVLLATQDVAAGAEIRYDHEALRTVGGVGSGGGGGGGSGGAAESWTSLSGQPHARGVRGAPSSRWRDVRLLPPPPAGADRAVAPTGEVEGAELLVWEGDGNGDERLRRLVPMLVTEGGRGWGLVSTHMPGRSAADCQARWFGALNSGLDIGGVDGCMSAANGKPATGCEVFVKKRSDELREEEPTMSDAEARSLALKEWERPSTPELAALKRKLAEQQQHRRDAWRDQPAAVRHASGGPPLTVGPLPSKRQRKASSVSAGPSTMAGEIGA